MADVEGAVEDSPAGRGRWGGANGGGQWRAGRGGMGRALQWRRASSGLRGDGTDVADVEAVMEDASACRARPWGCRTNGGGLWPGAWGGGVATGRQHGPWAAASWRWGQQ